MISTDNIKITEPDITDMVAQLTEIAKESPYYNDYADDIDNDDVKDALYRLRAAAENPYNADGYRHLFVLLALICDVDYED